jgi:hypothetical protein
MKFILTILAFLYINILAEAQEFVYPEHYQPQLNQSRASKQNNTILRAASIAIPFFDDFSKPGLFPDAELWLPGNVSLTRTHAILPPSVGTAKFDGIDSTGKPYRTGNITEYGLADELISKPINLSGLVSADSVYFSFYLQCKGLGNLPEPEDSFAVYFYAPKDTISKWKWQMSIEGGAASNFKQYILPVTNEIYLQDSFQIKFLNYATLGGDFDNWLLDYVLLDKNRSITDTARRDISFRINSKPLLKPYTEMPWNHYNISPSNFINDSLSVFIKNHEENPLVVSYSYFIKNNTTNVNIWGPFASAGNEGPRADINYVNLQTGFAFPAMTEATSFTVENRLNLLGDLHRWNDTIRQVQQFSNMFAYDDGSAEALYGLNQTNSSIAYKFQTYVADTIKALAVYFGQTNIDITQAPFRIKIWNNLIPENILYEQSTVSYPTFTDKVNGFVIYELTQPVFVSPGTYYIGWTQLQNKFLNLGLDLNNNINFNMYFNIGGGWQASIISGAWMLRPVMSGNIPKYVSVNSNEAIQFSIFPNPCKEILHIASTSNQNITAKLYDSSGRLVLHQTGHEKYTLHIKDLKSSIYLMIIEDSAGKILKTEKIIVQGDK